MERPVISHTRRGWWRNRWSHLELGWRRLGEGVRALLSHPLGLTGVVVVAIFGLMALAHPILMSTVWPRRLYDPILGFDATITPHPTPPSWRHLMGTDGLGRDVLSQLLAGARVSFSVGLLAAMVAVTISTLVGSIAGYYGGALDAVLMGVADVFVLLPPPVILLIFGLLLRMQWPVVAVAYGILAGLGTQAIVVKAHTLTLKAKPFIEAALCAGGDNVHIIRRHILPGLLPLTIVHAVFTVVGAVLTESLLSFFSRTSYYLSWGMMVWFGQETFRLFTLRGQWHAIAWPAIAIMLFCSAFYLIGRALDDIINPRLRRR